MRLACTFHVVGGKYNLVSGPEVPLPEQKAAFKAASVNPPKGVDAVELWLNSDVRSRKLSKSVEGASRQSGETPAGGPAIQPPQVPSSDSGENPASVDGSSDQPPLIPSAEVAEVTILKESPSAAENTAPESGKKSSKKS